MKPFFLHIVFFLFIRSILYAQVSPDNPHIIPSHESYAEKVYLQLDKTVYTSSETIWFKAIVTKASNHIPTDLSGILYVELINPYKKIIDKRLLKLNNGLADASFSLQNYESGQYLIRAYTKWNTNFEQDFIFNQYIQIHTLEEKADPIQAVTLTKTDSETFKLSAQLNPSLIDAKFKGKLKVYLTLDGKADSLEVKKDKTGYYNFDHPLPEETKQATLQLNLDNFNSFSKTIALNEDELDLQFFPEGGVLVSGLKSVVGFKAIDYAGKGKEVTGNIVDEEGQIISTFKSNHLGMGKVPFTPQLNKQYYGTITGSQGAVIKYPFPKASSVGMVLNITEDEKHINVLVSSNPSFEDKSISLRVRHRGVTDYYSNIKIKGKTFYKQFEKALFPEGIIEFTIFNSNQIPVCERLFFNINKKEQLNIVVKPNQTVYGQRDKIKLNIDIKDFNDVPVNGNLSVLVINKDQLGDMQALRQNIRSYFLLSSELKGEIEDSGYYFKDENKSEDLDVLMLTQGWRKYNYKTPKSIFINEPEKGLTVKGRIGEVINATKLSKKSVDLIMITFGDGAKEFYTQQVDSTGLFNFNIDDVYEDNLEVVIQSKNKKGKNKDYTIRLDKKKVPKIQYNPQKKIEVVDTIIDAFLEKAKAHEKVIDAFRKSEGTIELDEVLLDGYKLTPQREKMMKLHGPPDVVIEDKELQSKIKKWSFGLYSILLFNYPRELSVRRVGRNGGFLYANVHGANFTFIIIDGVPVKIENYSLIESLPTEEIKSVEIIKNPKNSLKYVNEVLGNPMALDPMATISFINIYTYAGKGLFSVQRTHGISKKTIPVFSTPREFYAPKYENLTTQDWKIPDLRSLVYWNANLQTNTDGKAVAEFYNADDIGDMLVVIETITADGKIGYQETTYTVEEKLER
ncbi:hypothetical protein [Thalassobellus citreus]|uniref:hypothetical protein n=1 Tax=Thalassobellus citreus TaxID=3367752 RepID=UPI0037A2214F